MCFPVSARPGLVFPSLPALLSVPVADWLVLSEELVAELVAEVCEFSVAALLVEELCGGSLELAAGGGLVPVLLLSVAEFGVDAELLP